MTSQRHRLVDLNKAGLEDLYYRAQTVAYASSQVLSWVVQIAWVSVVH